MKIEINRSKFINAINTVKDAVANEGSLAVLKNIKIEASNDGKIRLTATNLDIVVSTEEECKVSVPGTTTVPSKLFSSMLGALTSAEVTFDADDKPTGKAILRGGDVTYKIQFIGADEFPKEFKVEGKKMSFKQSEFKDMLRKTAYACSADSTRRSLMSVCLQGSKDGKVVAIGTDGRRLATMSKNKDGVEDFEMLIPPVTVKYLSRFLDGEEDVDIILNEHKAVLFKTKGWTLQSKLLDDAYPNWRQVIPKDVENKVAIERERFNEVIRQASISSASENTSITVALKDGVMTVSAANQDFSDAKVMLPVKFDGNEIKAMFNPKYLLDVTSSVDDDEIVLNITDGTKPITITCSDEGMLAVVLPLRIN